MKSGGRHGEFSKKAAQGPLMKLAAATYFGSASYEEFADVGTLPDGAIVAFGNAWGPGFPGSPAPTVLGSGKHTGQDPMSKDSKGRETLDHNSPDIAGVLAFYSVDLMQLQKVIRFDWGVGSISTGMIAPDGKGIIIAGRCGPAFATLTALAPVSARLPAMPEDPGPPAKRKSKPAEPGTLADVYVARFSPDGRPEWFCVLEKKDTPPQAFFLDRKATLFFDVKGLWRLSPDGKELKLFSPRSASGPRQWLGVDPTDGTAYYGGDNNRPTGREPYRNPFLFKVGPDDKVIWTLWSFPSREIGADDCRLVSDSSPRQMAFFPDGDMLIVGWSDGGNSVFPRQPTNWRQPMKGAGMGMSTWGMRSANQLCHLMRIDPRTQEGKWHAWWTAYTPSWFSDPKFRNAPNGLSIRALKALENGSLAVTGGAGTGLVQTPGCFWEDPTSGEKYGGEYVAVFRPDMTNLEFCSYVPGCTGLALSACRNGVVVASRSRGADGREKPTASPVLNAVQPEFKGATDGHLLLLRLP
jgi:hypothetical protein